MYTYIHIIYHTYGHIFCLKLQTPFFLWWSFNTEDTRWCWSILTGRWNKSKAATTPDRYIGVQSRANSNYWCMSSHGFPMLPPITNPHHHHHHHRHPPVHRPFSSLTNYCGRPASRSCWPMHPPITNPHDHHDLPVTSRSCWSVAGRCLRGCMYASICCGATKAFLFTQIIVGRAVGGWTDKEARSMIHVTYHTRKCYWKISRHSFKSVLVFAGNRDRLDYCLLWGVLF